MTAAIRTEQLTKRFGDFAAVDRLDLEVQAGEVFGFLGPNGAGKSTTIRCLLDLYHASSGRATLLGLDSHDHSLEIRRRLGYLPSDVALYPNLTGGEVIEYFANLRGGVDQANIDALAERFGADLSRKCSEYSSGNRQKVGLIQALMHEPELVIMDEPSSGLDPLVQQVFHEVVAEVRAEGRTVFLSSHTLSEVERIADRVGIIRRGRLVKVAAIDELKARAVRRVDLEFADEVSGDAFDGVPGVRDATAVGHHLSLSYDGDIEPVLTRATHLGVVNLNSREADLEEIFLTYYRDDDGQATTDEPAAEGIDAAR